MKKALVFENDAANLELLTVILIGLDFEVVAYPVKISFDEIINHQPDLILLDYFLDEGYGDEICFELKSNPVTISIPIILVSANANIEDIFNDSRADGFIAKPFEVEDLEDLIKKTAA